MSWVFGVYSKNEKILESDYRHIHKNPLKIFYDKKYYIAIGGIEDNILYQKVSIENYWLVCGQGIIHKNNNFSFMSKKDWQKYYNSEISKEDLNGHFLFIKWDRKSILIENDQLGVRELFYYQNDEVVVFSTRMDYIIKYLGKCEFDIKNLSGYIHFDMPMQDETFIKGISRLGACGKITWDSKKMIIKKKLWSPDKPKYTSILKLLNDLVSFPIKQNKIISLALSGGIDSRVLLAYLLQYKRNKFRVHTWGWENSSDVLIAQKIAKKFNLKIDLIKPTLYKSEELIAKHIEFAKETALIFPIYYMYDLTLEYQKYFEKNMVIIDGAEGEILRRMSNKKLFFKSKKAILNDDWDRIYKNIFIQKFDIFKTDIKRLLIKYSKELSDEFLQTMPKAKDIGIHNWIDIFTLRIRFIDKATVNQSRIDSVAVNYMPFAQRELINLIFQYPQEFRYKKKINKAIFAHYAPELTKIPIEKNGVIIPFTQNFVSSYIISKIKSKVVSSSQRDFRLHILEDLKDYVYDVFGSTKTINFDLYDRQKITNIIDGYYYRNQSNAKELSWLLSFDVWRRIV